jgi:hypothetical protein
MRTYYRSDTRSPEEIFKNGFINRLGDGIHQTIDNESTVKDAEELWLKFAIAPASKERSVDAFPDAAVCMTTNFRSSSIFPLQEIDTYIYAIRMPEHETIYLIDSENPEYISSDNSGEHWKNKVFDLHSLQAQQSGKIIETSFTELPHVDVAWPLYAYETIAFQVKPEYIIGVIPCINRGVDQTIISKSLKKYPEVFFDTGEFKKNPSFSVAQYRKWNTYPWISFHDHTEALEHFSNQQNRMGMCSPNVYSGLGGKTY